MPSPTPSSSPTFTTHLVVQSEVIEEGAFQTWFSNQVPALSKLPSYAWRWLNQPEEKVTIELVRQLQTQLSYTLTTPIQVILIRNLQSATTTAQNALLKLTEEPPRGVCLVLITSTLDRVLPTIQSRTHLLYATSEQTSEPSSLEDLPFELESVTATQVMAWSEELGDRAQALETCQRFIHLCLEKLAHNPDSVTVSQLQLLQSAWNDLSQNLNVKLTVEHYFLAISALNQAD